MAYKRSKRVARLLQQILSDTFLLKCKHPLLNKVVVSAVELTDNLRHARIYVYAACDDEQKKDLMSAVGDATGFLKKEIGHQADLKFIPELKFIFDDSMDYADHIDQLLRSLK